MILIRKRRKISAIKRPVFRLMLPMPVTILNIRGDHVSDNSVFCETFSNLLNSNVENCLPMSTVVKTVSAAVEKRQSQRCKYGKIKDMNNQAGNFYFIKRIESPNQNKQ
jgi:hypothetical protein